MKGGQKLLLSITRAFGNDQRAVRFQVPLQKLRPGRYTCQVSVVDEVGRKFAFSRAAMVLLESGK